MRTWLNFIKDKKIFFQKEKLIKKNSKILSFGSCFAVEIRKRLRLQELQVLPNYSSLEIDKNTFRIGNLPERDNINHYNTYTILYEFQRFENIFKQKSDDFWTVEDKWFGKNISYQDPYRRAIYAESKNLIFDITKEIDLEIKKSIEIADIIIITLGLTEVWVKKNNDMISCMNPGYAGGGGLEQTKFYSSNFADNLKNLKEIMNIINRKKHPSKVIFTVSPVPLGATFRNMDVVIANEESKSILRVAAAQIVKDYKNAYYFPAYELCKYSQNVFKEDGRHVKPEMIDKIVELFRLSFFENN